MHKKSHTKYDEVCVARTDSGLQASQSQLTL